MSKAAINYNCIDNWRQTQKPAKARRRIVKKPGGFIRNAIGVFYLIIVAAAFVLAGAVVVICLLSTPALEVKSIEISGLEKVKRQEILAIIDLWPGDNILALDLEELGRQGLAHPWIRDIELQRKLPNKVKVRVSERKPVALVQMDKLYYIDDQGTIFARATTQDGLDFPVVTGIEQKDAIDINSNTRQMLEKAVGIIMFFSRNKNMLPEAISEIHLDFVRGLSLVLEGSRTLILLGNKDILEKIGRLNMVLQALKREKGGHAVSSIDLNYTDRVVVCCNL